MKVLFNSTTNIVGGGVKNSAIFIKHACHYPEIDWLFVVSKPVKEILERWKIEDARIRLFPHSPSRNMEARRRLAMLTHQHSVDIVYTMAGPAYTKFPVTHIMGISNPYITHGSREAFILNRNAKHFFNIVISVLYQAFYASKADYWIFQTEAARNSFIKRFRVKRDKTYVITNSIGDEFIKYFMKRPFHTVSSNQPINIFCPAADYWHKALNFIPDIAMELKKISSSSNYTFKFTLTLKKDSNIWKTINKKSLKKGITHLIDNIGPYTYADAITLFEQADIVFVPSILETFSASYLEAFASKRPLIVSDRDFAHDICGNGALYVNPFDTVETAASIHELILDKRKQATLLKDALEKLKKYGTQTERVKKIINLIELLHAKGKH